MDYANVMLTHPKSEMPSELLVSRNDNVLEFIWGLCKMDSTDLTHLQRICERRKHNKTIGLHKNEFICQYTKYISLKSLTD